MVDKCGVCGGDNSGCQVVSGVFKRALSSLGYHRVLEIPQGATKINITEMHKSNNYLGKGLLQPPDLPFEMTAGMGTVPKKKCLSCSLVLGTHTPKPAFAYPGRGGLCRDWQLYGYSQRAAPLSVL